MAQDPYQELGVSRQASADEVRRAFRKLAKQLHPDKNPGDKASEERFKRVSAAFDLLVKLLQRDASQRICVKLRITPKSLRNALVLVVKHGWKRSQQMRCEDGSLALR